MNIPEQKQYIEVCCRTCRTSLIYTAEASTARRWANDHQATHPGHRLQGTLVHPSTGEETTIDIPNRSID